MQNIGKQLPPLSEHLKKKESQFRQKVYADPEVQAFLQAHQHQLTQAQLQDSFPVLQQYYFEKKQQNKATSTWLPTLTFKEGAIGISYHLSEVGYEQRKKAQQEEKMSCLFLPQSLKAANFKDMHLNQSKATLLERLLDFVDNYTQGKPHFQVGLYLYGPFGVGKTYAMAALCHALAERGVASLMVNVALLIQELKENFNSPKQEEQQRYFMRKMKQVPVLVLDDIGMESMSDWARDDILMPILQYRMQEEKSTFFTSNLSLEKLEKHFADTKTALNHLKAQRLIERISFLAMPFDVEDENIRQLSRK